MIGGRSPEDALEAALRRVATAPVLLVATDFDGTIAPIVANPGDARALPGAVDALGALSGIERTHVVAISGRAIAELARLGRFPPGIHLIGSHGAETSVGAGAGPTDGQRALLARVRSSLEAIAGGHPGCTIETKPASVALHYRNAPGVEEAAIRGIVLDGPGAWDGVHTKLGKKVIELSVVGSDKGTALRALGERLGADSVVFFGDDVTDEDVFRTLGPRDVGVKVGDGETGARFRVASPADVERWLGRLRGFRAGS